MTTPTTPTGPTGTTGTTGTADSGMTAEGTAVDTVVEAAVAELLAAVRAGRHDRVPGLLAPLDAAARKAALPLLKELRSEVRGWGWERWHDQMHAREALRVAGAGCLPGAAAAAAWIGARDLTGWTGQAVDGVLEVLDGRPSGWLADVAGRLAERQVAQDQYRLVHALVVRSGAAVPTAEPYLRGWTEALPERELLAALRADPQTPVLLPLVLALTEAPARLSWTTAADDPGHWPSALRALAEERVLDRAALVDCCVSRLLRGGRARDLRFPLAVLQALATTGEERRARIPDWLGMAADAPSPVAAHAQEILTGLALDGGLAVAELAELSGAVLFRPEKKLVRAQLTLLGKVLRRDPGQAAELLPVVTDAFGHEDTAIQQRALALVGRYLARVPEAVRAELAGAAELLSPVHRAAAAELFGGSVAGLPVAYEEVLPPVPERRPVAAPARTVPELMEELIVLARHPYDAPVDFERALDGVVRHAHRDREVLTARVREMFGQWHGFVGGEHVRSGSRGLMTVLAALAGEVGVSTLDLARRRPRGTARCAHEVLARVVDTRVWEVAWLLATAGPVPFLLATPTHHTGSVDPVVLVERLRAYRDGGVEPLPVDLAQALLRVRKADPLAARVAGEAAALGTRAGARLAAWLTEPESLAPGLRLRATSGTRGERTEGRRWFAERLVLAVRERRAIRDEFPPVFQWLGGAPAESSPGCNPYHWSGLRPLWPGILPDDREALAAWLLPPLGAAAEWELRGAAEGLTALAEAEGAAGPAFHLAVAVGLGCRHAEDRLTAVDALLVLAARGDLDPALLGARLAELTAEGMAKPNRLADALRTAAATGAYGTVRGVLLALLPSLIGGDRPVHGAGELLAVAAECVERAGAPSAAAGQREIPGLAVLAARGGTSRLVTQARRLAVALGQGVDQTAAQPVEIGS
ncbi:DUF6493 family protein [Streptomyces sp. NPDC090025]|uniref:DUF7824 domain-containing protein n=1 Tax=Streptomyces sp. NPDC090025 TaxID=3365922 RepID=UPI0038370ACD